MSKFYTAEVETIKSKKKGCWNTTKVTIFEVEGIWNDTAFKQKVEVGSYERNYSSYGKETFCPFQQNGQWYALFSPDYQQTHVMELPSCKTIAKDIESMFCPVEYYVPSFEELKWKDNEDYTEEDGEEPWNETLKKSIGTFGFVAGCVWGDDSSWKIQYIDLSKITEGKVVVDDRFGYLEMPRGPKWSLKDCLFLEGYNPTHKYGSDGFWLAHANYFQMDRHYYVPYPIECAADVEGLEPLGALASKEELLRILKKKNETIRTLTAALLKYFL